MELIGASSLWYRCGCVFVFVYLFVLLIISLLFFTCLHPSPALFRATTYSRGRRITHAVICVVNLLVFDCDISSINNKLITVVQNCCKSGSHKYRNGTFGGAATEKPLKRLTQNLAWVITPGTSLNTPSGMSIGFRGYPHKGVKC